MSETKKVTFKELQEVDQMVGGLYQKNAKLQESKFGYAYKRFADKNYIPLVKEFNEELGALRVQYALEDPATKEVLIDRMSPRGFKYNKTSLITLMAEEKKLADTWDNKVIEVVPFLSSYIPEDLETEQREMLDGLVL